MTHGVLALYGHVVRSCNFWIPQVGGGGGWNRTAKGLRILSVSGMRQRNRMSGIERNRRTVDEIGRIGLRKKEYL
jgi:hypothetical protein